MNRRPQLDLIAPSASPHEAAAISAALEQFMRNHTPAAIGSPERDPWLRTARLEGVDRLTRGSMAWGDGHPWG